MDTLKEITALLTDDVLERNTVEKVAERYKLEGEAMEFTFFWGHSKDEGGITKSCLSQWYECEFTVDGIKYRTAEQYMMAQKAKLFGDEEIFGMIMNARGPHDYKRLGRKVRNFEQETWDKNKLKIVAQGSAAKFSQNEKLGEFLKSTGKSIIVEASPNDSIWGIRMRIDDPGIGDPANWKGENLLGRALMAAREII